MYVHFCEVSSLLAAQGPGLFVLVTCLSLGQVRSVGHPAAVCGQSCELCVTCMFGRLSRESGTGTGAGSKAVMEIKGLWHPCAVSRASGDAVVPNDLILGSPGQDG